MSLLLGIGSFVVLPVVAAVAAIVTGVKAQNAIDSSRGLRSGRRLATTGVALGIVNAVVFSLASVLVAVHVTQGQVHTDYTRLRVGDCYNLTGAGYVDRVACARPHHAEVTGSFQLAVHGGYPAAAGFQSLAQPRCQALASQYLGSTTRVDLGYVWITPDRSAWDGGTRTVVCGLQNVDRSLRTGSLRP